MRITIFASLLAAASLSACAGEPDGVAPQSRPAEGGAGIGTFTATDYDFYCTFLPEGFDAEGLDRPQIELLFVTLFDDADNRARVMLDGETRTLVPTEPGDAYSVIEEGRPVTYTVEGMAGRTVSALATKTGEAREQTEYDIEITDDATGETARGSGGCGV